MRDTTMSPDITADDVEKIMAELVSPSAQKHIDNHWPDCAAYMGAACTCGLEVSK